MPPPKAAKPAEQKPATDAEEMGVKKPGAAKLRGTKKQPAANGARGKPAAKNGQPARQEK